MDSIDRLNALCNWILYTNVETNQKQSRNPFWNYDDQSNTYCRRCIRKRLRPFALPDRFRSSTWPYHRRSAIRVPAFVLCIQFRKLLWKICVCIFTFMYRCEKISEPSFSHVICGRGLPLATHKKAILCPRTYSRSKWDACRILAPWKALFVSQYVCTFTLQLCSLHCCCCSIDPIRDRDICQWWASQFASV